MYNFHRLVRIKEARQRSKKYAKILDNRYKNSLRNPLEIGKKVLVLAERLRK